MNPRVESANGSHAQRHAGQISIALGVFVLGVAMAIGTAQFPEATGYAKVGPRLMPFIVSGGLIVLSLLLLKEAFFGGFRGVDEVDAAATPTDWRAFGWISVGLIANGVLMVHAGFVIAGTLLFVMAARGFGSRAWLRNALIGATIAVLTYAFFSYGLGLQLPRGILPY